MRQAAPIAPTIGGFSSLRSSEIRWPDTVEPTTRSADHLEVHPGTPSPSRARGRTPARARPQLHVPMHVHGRPDVRLPTPERTTRARARETLHGDGHARGYVHDNGHGHVHRRYVFASRARGRTIANCPSPAHLPTRFPEEPFHHMSSSLFDCAESIARRRTSPRSSMPSQTRPGQADRPALELAPPEPISYPAMSATQPHRDRARRETIAT
jgi:hypothetical protein